MRAAQYDRPQSLKLLLERGANIERPQHCKYSALLFAAEHRHVECAALLLRYGADVNMKDRSGVRTALDLVQLDLVHSDSMQILRLLVYCGAHAGAHAAYRQTPFVISLFRSKKDCRSATRCVLGILRNKVQNGRHLGAIIGKLIWSTRVCKDIWVPTQ
jgi:ankyrin repeat protein